MTTGFISSSGLIFTAGTDCLPLWFQQVSQDGLPWLPQGTCPAQFQWPGHLSMCEGSLHTGHMNPQAGERCSPGGSRVLSLRGGRFALAGWLGKQPRWSERWSLWDRVGVLLPRNASDIEWKTEQCQVQRRPGIGSGCGGERGCRNNFCGSWSELSPAHHGERGSRGDTLGFPGDGRTSAYNWIRPRRGDQRASSAAGPPRKHRGVSSLCLRGLSKPRLWLLTSGKP